MRVFIIRHGSWCLLCALIVKLTLSSRRLSHELGHQHLVNASRCGSRCSELSQSPATGRVRLGWVAIRRSRHSGRSARRIAVIRFSLIRMPRPKHKSSQTTSSPCLRTSVRPPSFPLASVRATCGSPPSVTHRSFARKDRCLQTAAPTARALGVPIWVEHGLHFRRRCLHL
jgi:hypothetical protein